MSHTPPSPAPLFSVVIATYNYGHLVERAIRSVLEQTYAGFELIVVDDGSTDDTETRLAAYSERLRYIHKPNGGQSSAYNLGADSASGEYVYILDADDELYPDTLANFARVIDAHRAQGTHERIFYGSYTSVSEEGQEKARESVQAPAQDVERMKAFIEKQVSGLQNGAFVIPRTAFQRIRYPEHLRHNTDLVFLGQALSLYPATAIKPLVLKSHAHPQRSRKQSGSNIAHSTAPVEAMFDPAVVGERFQPLKPLFLAARLRSLARMHYLSGNYAAARDAYRLALSTRPKVMLEAGSIKRYVLSELRALF